MKVAIMLKFKMQKPSAGRKKFCLVFCLFLFPFLIVGCTAKKSAKATPKLIVWHWMSDRQQAFEELAQKYEASTGVKVDFELYAPSDIYSQKVRAAAQGENLPDVFGILGEKRDFASFIKGGHVLDLTPYMDANSYKWRNSFFNKALALNEFTEGNSYGVNAGVYGVPIDIMTIQMVYNKDLFKELGLNPENPPANLAEFLDIGKKVKQANVQGLVSGWGELWMIDCFANNYAFNIMGKDKVLATIKGEVPYTDPDWVGVLNVFKEMRDSGILSAGLVTMINKTAEQLFANGKAVFAFNGSWCVNVYKAMNPNLNYGAMLPPKAWDQYPMAIWGGAGSSFMVNARSKNKEEGVKFLRWFSDEQQQAYLSEATNNLPANKQSASNISEINTQFALGLDYATHPNAWGVSEFPMVIETWDKGIQSIILGEKTPKQVAAETQAVKERELARKHKMEINKKGAASGTSG